MPFQILAHRAGEPMMHILADVTFGAGYMLRSAASSHRKMDGEQS